MDLTTNPGVDKRTNTVRELYTSETVYITSLQNIVDGLVKPIKALDTLTKEEINSIFSNIDSINNLHTGIFMPELVEVVSKWTDTSQLGKVFQSFGHGLNLYTQYCSNYEQSIVSIQNLRKHNQKFEQFVKEAQASPRFGGSLSNYLIQPIQRIPRYKMFLEQLVKLTPQDHPDYVDLNASLVLVSDIAVTVDEVCAKVENMQKVIEISKSVGMDNLLSPTRRYEKLDDLEVLLNNNTYNARCYLFNDLIVLSMERRGKSLKNFRFPLGLSWIPQLGNTAKSFDLLTTTAHFTLQFSTPDAKTLWENEYNRLLTELLKNKKHSAERTNYVLIEENGLASLQSLQTEYRMTKKKSKISVFHDSLKAFGNSKARKKKEAGALPDGPPTRRRSLDHDLGPETPVPRELSAALQGPSHSDTSADTNAIRKTLKVGDKTSKLRMQSQKYGTMKKTTSTMNLHSNSKPLKQEPADE